MFKRETTSDKIFLSFLFVVLMCAGFITFYPFFYVICVSLSDPVVFFKEGISFFPRSISLDGYEAVFFGNAIWRTLKNTAIITLGGTSLALLLTSMGGYVISRKRLVFRNFFIILTLIPMYFSGGMIPSYLLILDLNLYNTFWALIIPGAVSTYYIVLARSYYDSLPKELEESAWIDGANDIYIFVKIMLPLAKPILAVLLLYYAVGFWNTYLPAVMYLIDASKHPIQVYLANIIINNSMAEGVAGLARDAQHQVAVSHQIKYTLIIVGIAPIIMVYPFIQKYLVKGMMLGSLKG